MFDKNRQRIELRFSVRMHRTAQPVVNCSQVYVCHQWFTIPPTFLMITLFLKTSSSLMIMIAIIKYVIQYYNHNTNEI